MPVRSGSPCAGGDGAGRPMGAGGLSLRGGGSSAVRIRPVSTIPAKIPDVTTGGRRRVVESWRRSGHRTSIFGGGGGRTFGSVTVSTPSASRR